MDLVASHEDKKRKCVDVFLDFAKAFDTVSVPGPLDKMDEVGIRGKTHEFFASCLKNRTQRVTIHGFTSSDKQIHYRVPQGSVLGPKLFHYYI